MTDKITKPAPELIYIQRDGSNYFGFDYEWAFEPINEDDIEYVRADLYEAAQTTIAELNAKLETARLNFEALMVDCVGR